MPPAPRRPARGPGPAASRASPDDARPAARHGIAAAALELARLGARAATLREAREAMLDVLADVVPWDAALVHALSPRVPLSTAAVRGLEESVLVRSARGWDDLAVELGALREAANARLAVSDDELFAPGTRARARFLRRLAEHLGGMRSLCLVHLVVRERVGGAVVLLARREHAFDARAVARLRRLAPLLGVIDALHGELDGAPRARSPVRLRCRDQRLTSRQRQIVEHVVTGCTNAEIGAALGLSPHSVRNHLARIFTRVGAANRADLVRLAVLLPDAEAPPARV